MNQNRVVCYGLCAAPKLIVGGRREAHGDVHVHQFDVDPVPQMEMPMQRIVNARYILWCSNQKNTCVIAKLQRRDLIIYFGENLSPWRA